ncbi:putative ubiquitin-conjugating enzyme E2, ubiquitin-conjugating enzyme/RWD [Helianthus annuus]|nr:putative ubiquitin-conjugating enzyme E2, ubiquitin-conjugating enzyme/RWD [Helianthus annuus]
MESRKRVFWGGSSSAADPDVIEIAPPLLDRTAITKAKGKQKEVAYHEIIDVDMDEDCDDVMFLEAKVESDKKAKVGTGSSLGSSSAANSGLNNFIDLDDYVDDYVFDDEYLALQAHFDDIGLPAGIEAPIPWLPDLVAMKKDKPAIPFVSQPNSVDPMPTSAFNSSSKSTTIHGQSPYFDPKPVPMHSNFTQNGSGNYLSNNFSTQVGNGSSSFPDPLGMDYKWYESFEKNIAYPQLAMNTTDMLSGTGSMYSMDDIDMLLGQDASVNVPSPISSSGLTKLKKSYEGFKKYDASVNGPSSVSSSRLAKLKKALKKIDASVNDPSSISSSSVESSSSLAKFLDGDVKKRYESFKKFDTVVDHSDHHYIKKSSAMTQPPKNWAKKIQEEWKILEKDLPDTIFVRVYESRMDLLRAVIIGAEGTPYHDGLFFFDVCFPSGYPNTPPLVHYHSGGLRINPNLYNCGKVCLSLLNTWTGVQNERWIPGTSTMLQVLVSIQGLILNAKPYFNEPGYANSSGSVHGEQSSLHYNENTLILSLKTMVYTMKKPPKYFEDLVIGHFQHHVRDILMACKAYTEGVQVGCVVKGGLQKVGEGNNSCSAKFKHDVASYVKTLVAAFERIGAKEAQEFLSLIKESSLPTEPGPGPVLGPGPAFSPFPFPFPGPAYKPTSPSYAPGYPYSSISAAYNQHW